MSTSCSVWPPGANFPHSRCLSYEDPPNTYGGPYVYINVDYTNMILQNGNKHVEWKIFERYFTNPQHQNTLTRTDYILRLQRYNHNLGGWENCESHSGWVDVNSPTPRHWLTDTNPVGEHRLWIDITDHSTGFDYGVGYWTVPD